MVALVLVGSLVVPAIVAAAEPTYGFTQSSPTPSTVNYSDLVTFRGAFTCVNGAEESALCPTGTLNHVATFALRPTGGSTFTTVATANVFFSFASSSSGCPTTCSRPFQVQWKAGRAPGSITIPPGTYDVRLTTTLTADEVILASGLVITPEGTTTTYGGAMTGDEGTLLPLAVSVVDLDRGLLAGTGIFLPDSNLGAGTSVTFALYDATNTVLRAGPVSASLSGTGSALGSPSLVLPAAGTYMLRSTYEGNTYYTTSADLDTVTSNSVNAAPTLTVPGPMTAEATSGAGAAVDFVVSAGDEEDDPDPVASCDWASGATFPLGTTTVHCSVTDSGGLTVSDTFTVSVMDTTSPIVDISTSEAADASGWYNLASDDGAAGVTIDVVAGDAVGVINLSCTDNGLDVGILDANGDSFVLGDGHHWIECSASDGAGNGASDNGSFDVDQTAPAINAVVSPGAAATGWWNAATGAPTVTYTCADALSGLAACASPRVFGEGLDQGDVGLALDLAGNVATATVSGLDVDLTAPTDITFVGGGLTDGAGYTVGLVPSGPSGCAAVFDLAGPGGCVVSGYSALVGSQTVTATATDAAGNLGTAFLHYDVLPVTWTLIGFAQPVDMGVVNTLKGGRPVPLKFEIFAGATELTTLDAVLSLTQTQTSCTFGSVLAAPVDATSNGRTGLRYDSDAGTYILNWQSPAQPDTCWLVTLTTMDGSSIAAAFRLR
jgi:hypothetical protein